MPWYCCSFKNSFHGRRGFNSYVLVNQQTPEAAMPPHIKITWMLVEVTVGTRSLLIWHRNPTLIVELLLPMRFRQVWPQSWPCFELRTPSSIFAVYPLANFKVKFARVFQKVIREFLQSQNYLFPQPLS